MSNLHVIKNINAYGPIEAEHNLDCNQSPFLEPSD
jgi:hypothetical protein